MVVCDIRWQLSLLKNNYIVISWFWAFLEVKTLGKVQMITCQDSQSKVQMLTLFYRPVILVHHRCAPTWSFHTTLCKFLRNNLTNIWIVGKCTGLKLGELSSLFIFYNITISWLFPLDNLRFIFYSVTVKTIHCYKSEKGFAQAYLLRCLSSKRRSLKRSLKRNGGLNSVIKPNPEQLT